MKESKSLVHIQKILFIPITSTDAEIAIFLKSLRILMISKIFCKSSLLFSEQASTLSQPSKHGLVACNIGSAFHRRQYFFDSIEGDIWSFLSLFLRFQSFCPRIQKLAGPTYSSGLFHPAAFFMILQCVQRTFRFIVGNGGNLGEATLRKLFFKATARSGLDIRSASDSRRSVRVARLTNLINEIGMMHNPLI